MASTAVWRCARVGGGSCASLLYGIAPKAGALIAAWTLQGVGAVPDAEGFAVLQARFC
jgi:hypothetical protein